MQFPYCKVSEEAIRIEALTALVRRDEDGGVASFVGTVRNHDAGRGVTKLEYTAYPEMAEKVMREVCEAAMAEFGVEHVAAVHRIGVMDIGAPVVAVVVASPHRANCLDAVRYIIDEIKANAPIWKKEHYTGASPAWKETDNQAWEA